MPLPTTMGFAFAPAEITALNGAITTLLDTINSKGAVNLIKAERQAATSVSNTRFPYVEKTFNSLAPNYLSLRPPFMDFSAALLDFQYMAALRDLNTRIAQVVEVYSDHALASENLAFRYMLEFYSMAQRGAQQNVPGADTCLDELSPLFERANAPAAPGPDAPPAP